MNHVNRFMSNTCGTLAVALSMSVAQAQTTERMSESATGTLGNGTSARPSVSADGRFVAFESAANNLGPSDTNGVLDVYLRDRQTGTIELLSVSSTGVQGNDDSGAPSISADGRYVAFHSKATNLVGFPTGHWDIFLRDRQTNTTERISYGLSGAQGNGDSLWPRISATGRYVVFESAATNLTTSDTNNAWDIFRRDRQTSTTACMSVNSFGVIGSGNSVGADVSPDGRYVTFSSVGTNLVPGDTNLLSDIFVRDVQSATTARINMSTTGGEANGVSDGPSISDDGRYVAFQSVATNLVSGDTNGRKDIFVRDCLAALTHRASVSPTGVQGNGDSSGPSLSPDGRFVAFTSAATNLITPDTTFTDVFVHDCQSGSLEFTSMSSAGVHGDQDSFDASLSADGHFVAFASFSTNLVTSSDTNLASDVFVHSRTGTTAPYSFCFGDFAAADCPCGNFGATGRGCENSAGLGGALLTVAGTASISSDTVVFTSSFELATATSIVLQGNASIPPQAYGDGARCAGGSLLRLYVKSAAGGVVTAPQGSDPSVSARSAALGDTLTIGATRYYQVDYRDPSTVFCPAPPGGLQNISNAIAVVWDP